MVNVHGGTDGKAMIVKDMTFHNGQCTHGTQCCVIEADGKKYFRKIFKQDDSWNGVLGLPRRKRYALELEVGRTCLARGIPTFEIVSHDDGEMSITYRYYEGLKLVRHHISDENRMQTAEELVSIYNDFKDITFTYEPQRFTDEYLAGLGDISMQCYLSRSEHKISRQLLDDTTGVWKAEAAKTGYENFAGTFDGITGNSALYGGRIHIYDFESTGLMPFEFVLSRIITETSWYGLSLPGVNTYLLNLFLMNFFVIGLAGGTLHGIQFDALLFRHLSGALKRTAVAEYLMRLEKDFFSAERS